MANKMTKKELFYKALSKQVDFSKNVDELNTDDARILGKAAKEYGYRFSLYDLIGYVDSLVIDRIYNHYLELKKA